MITEQHSEELDVWALRSRVWGFLVKPVSEEGVMRTLNALYRARLIKSDPVRTMIVPPPPLPSEVRFVEQSLDRSLREGVIHL